MPERDGQERLRTWTLYVELLTEAEAHLAESQEQVYALAIAYHRRQIALYAVEGKDAVANPRDAELRTLRAQIFDKKEEVRAFIAHRDQLKACDISQLPVQIQDAGDAEEFIAAL